MSIQKKSLISTLKTAKKANVAKSDLAETHKGDKQVSPAKFIGLRAIRGKAIGSSKQISGKDMTSFRYMG